MNNLIEAVSIIAAAMAVSFGAIGPALGEATALRVGHAYEQATDWKTRRPPLSMDR